MKQALHGAFLLDKPEGISSAGVINKLKGMLRSYGYRGRALPKIGHGGTLDPFATGLLVILIGHGTSIASHRLKDDKSYAGKIRMGEKTPSADPETEVCERGTVPNYFDMKNAAEKMIGPYMQIPPMHSAKKVKGKRLYEMARKGKEIHREPVQCAIRNFEISEGRAKNEIEFEVECSSGTFVRTLAEDLAKSLGTFAHLTELDRLGSGDFKKSRALSLDGFQALTIEGGDWTETTSYVSMEELLKDWSTFQVSQEDEEKLLLGRLDRLRELLCDYSCDKMALKGKDRYIGLAHQSKEEWHFTRMFS